LKQGWRIFKTVGWLWLIGLPLFFILFLGFLNNLRDASPYTITLVALMAPIAIHNKRKDYPFLISIGTKPQLIYVIEYIAISLIIVLPCYFLYKQSLPFLLSFAGAIILAFIPISNRIKWKRSHFLLDKIPIQAFEWRAGLRQYGWIIAILYMLGLAGSYWIAPPLLAILLIVSILPAFYDSCEPKEWLETLLPHIHSLRSKAVLHLKLLIIGMIPLSISFLIFSTSYWYVLVVVWIFSCLYVLFGLFYKYAHYQAGRKKVHNSLVSGMVAIGFAIPFTMPVGIFYLWWLYRKALKRLWG
jgi:hypothetical protein